MAINLKIDRGLELNKKRQAGEFVDVTFIVEDKEFPARMMIFEISNIL